LEYHAAARFAALSAFMPMAGVLFHHAIELYLKGLLCDRLDERERRDLGHNLRRLWKLYKQAVGATEDLSHFDRVIAEADGFERVRYPDRIIEHGIRTAITFAREEFSDQSTPPRREPLYVVTVDEIDALAALLWKHSRLNPRVFTMSFKEFTRDYLGQFNKSRFW